MMEVKKIRLYDSFLMSLGEFVKSDAVLLKWKNNRLPVSHKFAEHMQKTIVKYNMNLSVDLCLSMPGFGKNLSPEIVVCNRKTKKISLCVVCRNDYLSQEEQNALFSLYKKNKDSLVLAISFFSSKNYFLIYHVTPKGLEYYHFNKESLTSEILKINSKEEKADYGQLMLGYSGS